MYGCAFFILEQTAQNNQTPGKATLLLLLVGCKQAFLHARVGPEESSAPVGLAWLACFWHVEFVCGPQLVGLQRT